MNINDRAKEISEKIGFIEKKEYRKKDVLPTLKELENKIVGIINEGKEVSFSKRLMKEVYKELKEKNDKFNGVFTKDLKEFEKYANEFIYKIQSESRGVDGERILFKNLKTTNNVLENIILSDYYDISKFDYNDVLEGEIDAIVITGQGIYLLEVKNPYNDIEIDENGNYVRMSSDGLDRYSTYIGLQLQNKEMLLKNVLESLSFFRVKELEIKIKTRVVVVNPNVKIKNNCSYINCCRIADIINEINSDEEQKIYDERKIELIKRCIKDANIEKAYEIDIDIKSLINSFSILQAKIEEAEEKESCENIQNKQENEKDVESFKVKDFALGAFFGGVAVCLVTEAVMLYNEMKS